MIKYLNVFQFQIHPRMFNTLRVGNFSLLKLVKMPHLSVFSVDSKYLAFSCEVLSVFFNCTNHCTVSVMCNFHYPICCLLVFIHLAVFFCAKVKQFHFLVKQVAAITRRCLSSLGLISFNSPLEMEVVIRLPMKAVLLSS